MRVFILIFYFFFNVLNLVIAQPSAPAAGNLSSANFVDVPVSPFTGTTSYSIPMGAVTSGNLTLAISLDYHSGANVVGAVPGPAGLGWDLNLGGGITRTVRGVRDEEDGGYWNNPTPNTSNLSGGNFNDVKDGDMDGEPDILTWRIPGKGGKFYLDRNHQVVHLSKTDVQVNMLAPSSTNNPFELGFEIVNSDGTIYRFNNPNYQRENNSGNPYVIGWVLSKMESYDGHDQIIFNYSGKQSYQYRILNLPTFSGHNANDFNNVDEMDDPVDITVIEQKLQSIQGTNTNANFIYSTRVDLEECSVCPNLSTHIGGPISDFSLKLDRIEFSTGNFCYKQMLSHEYFYSTNVSTSNPELTMLMLNEVVKKSCNNSEVENPYSLDYYTSVYSNGVSFFPKDLDKNIDHYGYYNKPNGIDNNSASKNMIQNGTTAYGVSVGNSNREPFADKAEYGLLKKIVTPTKGVIEYDYEGNDYAYTKESTTLFSLNDDCLILNEEYSDPILIEQDLYDTGYLKLTQSWQNYSQGGNCMNQVPHYIKFRVRHPSTNAILYEQTFYSYSYSAGSATYYVNLDNISQIQVGNSYKFSMFVWNTSGTMELTFDDEISGNGGGVRIKEIKTWDGVSTATENRKIFHYDKFNTPGESSGFLVAEPKYKENFGVGGIVCSAYSHAPLTNIDGLALGYQNVAIETVGLGSVKYTFEQEPAPASFGFPKQPNEDLSGNLLLNSVENNQSNEISSTVSTHARQQVLSDFFHVTTLLDNSLYYNDYKINTKRFNYITTTTSVTDGISSSSNLTYDLTAIPVILGPTESSFINSDGTTYTQKTYYTGHYVEDANIKAKLRDFNINQPYKTTKETASQIDGSRTLFRIFNASGNPTCSTCNGFPRPEKLDRYERTWDDQGILGSGNWVRQKTFKNYGHLGKLTKYDEPGFNDSYINYLSNTYQVSSKSYDGYLTSYSYFPNSLLLQTTTNVDGTTSTYAYDDLLRLESASEDCKGITAAYEYYYSPPGNNTKHYTKKSILFSGATNSNSALSNIEEYTYFDNLGRAIQNVRKAQSPNNKDIVSSSEYDQYGRMTKSFLPVESTTGNGSFLTIQSSWDHTVYQYEASPQSRKLSETPPDWYASTYAYDGNSSGDLVKDPETNFTYPANSLMRSTSIDANGNRSIAFTDKIGQTILTRQTNASGGDKKDTYYKYDDKGRLSAVVAPGAYWSQTDLNYYYYYTGDDKLLKKKIPAAGEVEFVYNDKDLMAGWQDANMGNSQWMAFSYDSFGRELKSGLVYSSTISNLNNPSFSNVLTENIYGTSGIEKGKLKTVKSKVLGTSNFLQSTNHYDACGRLQSTTGNNHMNIGNTSNGLTSNFTYDKGDNVTQTDFSINTISETNTVSHINQYDHIGRGVANKFQYNNGTIKKLSEQVYNHREELITKYQGEYLSENPTFHQEINYFYKTNGLLDRINQPQYTEITPYTQCTTDPAPTNYSNYNARDLFYLQLHYDVPIPGTTAASRKNGEISGARWQTKGRSLQQYAYTYDHLGQLKTAKYYDFDHTTNQLVNTDRYSTTYNYDSRGNITHLTRKGAIDGNKCAQTLDFDNLVYSYTSGNKVNSIYDNASGKAQYSFLNAAGNYTYDANGNLTSDPYKGITLILYNHLNKPTEVRKNGQQKIVFSYDASGTMLNKKYYDYYGTLVENRDYIGGLEYVSGALESIMHAEGRYLKTGQFTGRHEYHLKDHLGNTRIVYSDLNGDGIIKLTDNEIIQESHYYPYGMEMKGNYLQSSGTDYRYKYNDIERVKDMGLDVDFAFYRTLDPVVGRWWQVDPKGENFFGLSGYNSMGNNPVSFVDPEGDFITWGIGNRGLSVGFNLTPIGIPLGAGINVGFGNGGSIGVYGEVGYRIGGRGFGSGATVSQSFDYSFKGGGLNASTSAGVYASLGGVNVGASIGTSGWRVSAGVGFGNEKGGVGLFIGYGSSGFSYGIGGYVDPRVKFEKAKRVLILNDDGTYTDLKNQIDFKKGYSDENHDYSTNLINNPNVEIVDNGDGTYTYIINTPNRHNVNNLRYYKRNEMDFLINFTDINNGKVSFTSLGPKEKVILFSERPKTGDYFNFKNFNVKMTNRGRQPLWYLNLFGRK